MDGVHPPRYVEWRWCVLLLSCPVQCVWPMPSTPSAYRESTAVMSCTVLARCCGVWVVSVCLCRSCGGVSSVCPPPSSWMVGGAIADGGWHGEGRAAVLLASPSCVWCPPSVYVVVPLNGGSGVCCVVPVFGLDVPSSLCPPLPYRDHPHSFFVCVLSCLPRGGACSVPCLPVFLSSCLASHALCLLSQHC